MAKKEVWKHTEGSLDIFNMSYAVPLNNKGFPIIRNQEVGIPKQMIMYKNHKKCTELDALHFFIDDYRFEHLWNNPKKYLERLSNKILLSPDFSLYIDYPDPVIRWNVYRSRWLGAYWQTYGFPVIPTVSWGDESTYDYCFSGIEYGSTVAISGRGNHKSKRAFSSGVDEMIEQIGPERILSYGSFRKFYEGKNMIQNLIVYSTTSKIGQYDSAKATINHPLIPELV
jgi:hypothetical protein